MTISGKAAKKHYLVIAAILLSLAVGACSRNNTESSNLAQAAEQGSQNPAPEITSPPDSKRLGQAETDIEVNEPPATPIATVNPTDPATLEPPTAEPTEMVPTAVTFVPSDRTALVSTNPADFNVASGQLQLVEFMAFW